MRSHRKRSASCRGSLAARCPGGPVGVDPSVRFAAMQRLASVPAHRAAVAEAARSLLADENLPARAVTHVTRWARRNRLPLAAR